MVFLCFMRTIIILSRINIDNNEASYHTGECIVYTKRTNERVKYQINEGVATIEKFCRALGKIYLQAKEKYSTTMTTFRAIKLFYKKIY